MELWQLVILLNIIGFYLFYSYVRYLHGRMDDIEWEWKERKKEYEEQIETKQREIDALKA